VSMRGPFFFGSGLRSWTFAAADAGIVVLLHPVP
jgi:hypothetical protein